MAWADDAHPDTLAPVAGTRREFLVWIWYPSAPGQPTAGMDDYLPATMRAAGTRPPSIAAHEIADAGSVAGPYAQSSELRRLTAAALVSGGDLQSGSFRPGDELLDARRGSGQPWLRRRGLRCPNTAPGSSFSRMAANHFTSATMGHC